MTDGADSYRAFLEGKIASADAHGFEVDPAELHPWLKPHCRAIVPWALKGGRRAIFASFGLHKTSMQLEIMRQVGRREAGPRLIVHPLGVRQEFKADAVTMGMTVRFIRSDAEITAGDHVHLTNYESVREGKVTPARFVAASLDEASVLRSFGSKTYQEFLPLFGSVPYRFAATATPSPNRYKELIHYAGFLGVMDTGQALTRFFQRNASKAGDLTLYPHKEDEFWLWVHSWAIFIQRPSDLGFSDDGYELPPLDLRWHEVPSDHARAGADRRGQGQMFRNIALGVTAAAAEKRDSLGLRVGKMVELLAEAPGEHSLLWHDLEAERHAIEAAVPGAVSITGSMAIDERERRVIDFSQGRIRHFATKPILSGSGCNFQHHCHRAIFVGVGFKFHDFIQAIHRIQRFGQASPVRVDIIHSEAERGVVAELKAKWARHDAMMARMAALIRKYGLNHAPAAERLRRTIGVVRQEASGEGWPETGWRVANNDCVAEAGLQESDSVDLVVTSIPFANQYEYTPAYEDFGHTEDNRQFWAQMDFLTPSLFRILRPGRLACLHVKDRILFGAVTGAGAPTVSPFHAEAILHGRAHGFDFMGMITIVTDVVRENNQTYRLGYSEMCKDGTKMGVGSPEYVVLLRKPQSDRARGYADVPVAKDKPSYSLARWQVDAHAFWRSSGDRLVTADELAARLRDMSMAQIVAVMGKLSAAEIYDHDYLVRVGELLGDRLPKTFMALAPSSHDENVWHDVNRMATLNAAQAARNVEKHVCLAVGSLVLTRDGYKPIQNVLVGDHVLTHKGRWRPVVVVRNTGVRPVVKLMAQGIPGLTLTPDHNLWTRVVRNLPWSRSHSRREATSVEPSWVRADATVGSYVNTRLPDAEAVVGDDGHLWWTVGRWLADGHLGSRGEIVISCGRHEKDALLASLGSRAGSVRSTGSAVQIRIRDRDRALRMIIARCGKGAGGKHLPPEAILLPAAPARALLDGYLSGDGHYVAGRDRWTASSISKNLVLGLALLVQRAYGAVASIYPGRKGGASIIQGREVVTRPEWVLCFDVPRPGCRRMPMILADGAWKKVRAIEDAGEAETWCLRVADDESFTAEGCIVKNCPLQFDIVDRLIERWSNRGDLVYDPFGGLMTVPLRALRLGRRGQASELSAAYFADGVHYLRAAERELAVPTLFDLETRALPAEQEAAE